MLRPFQRICLILACLLPGLSLAQPRDSIEGIHYQALSRLVPTDTDPDHIEVREMFWYGCPQCATLEPMMTDWRDGVTGDLFFTRTPAVWNEIMALHARIYYTAQSLNAGDRIHRAAFTAISEQQRALRTEAEIRAFFSENGIGAEAFDSAWNDPDVMAAVDLARTRTQDYELDKLPALIVNGRFRLTHNQHVPDHVELNIALNMVIRRLRDERRSDF